MQMKGGIYSSVRAYKNTLISFNPIVMIVYKNFIFTIYLFLFSADGKDFQLHNMIIENNKKLNKLVSQHFIFIYVCRTMYNNYCRDYNTRINFFLMYTSL